MGGRKARKEGDRGREERGRLITKGRGGGRGKEGGRGVGREVEEEGEGGEG